ncbi:MAG: 23S rRNA (uracil(1939)-C(5))-methyltransferase RlmD [Leptolyngbyaceae cyanobacterium]
MVNWQQGETLELEITDLSSQGEGVGRWEGRVVFVPDTVPGDRIQVRLTFVKPTFGRAKVLKILESSTNRVRPACIVADKCGGCQWQAVDYPVQAKAKEQHVQDALKRIGGFQTVPIAPILAAGQPLRYRNKVTYPLALSAEGQVKAGYYRKGTHQIINLNQCPVQDERLNILLKEVKQDIQQQGWGIYDAETHQRGLRHLAFRVGRRTGEMLLTLVSSTWALPGIELMASEWKERYPDLAGVCINRNEARGNTIFGSETRYVVGRPYLEERFAGLRFHIYPTTFFQVYTEQAERLLGCIVDELALTGQEILVDAYCGIGTLTLPLARRVDKAFGIEVQQEAVETAQENTKLNGIKNARFQAGSVASLLPKVTERFGRAPDVVLLDPPRKGCQDSVLSTLVEMRPARIVYMSCNPATLARDLKQLCGPGGYQLRHVQPADFFPQTAHVECVAFLVA